MNLLSKQSVLLALAGIGLSCCAGVLPVSADDQDSYVDPMPLSYPFAAPGMLDMRHWTDYTQTKIENGSVSDKRMEMRKMQDEQTLSGKPIQDDPEKLDPMPLSYPFASPGMLDMRHWTDYTQTKIENGSPEDRRWEQEKKQNEQTLSGQPITDDPEMLDPMPLSYPFAAPGMLDTRHWTDYTQTKIENGSVSDVHFDRDKRMREKMEQK